MQYPKLVYWHEKGENEPLQFVEVLTLEEEQEKLAEGYILNYKDVKTTTEPAKRGRGRPPKAEEAPKKSLFED